MDASHCLHIWESITETDLSQAASNRGKRGLGNVIYKTNQYGCAAWHAGLTKQDSEAWNPLKKSNMFVTYPGISYWEVLQAVKLQTLNVRRVILQKKISCVSTYYRHAEKSLTN